MSMPVFKEPIVFVDVDDTLVSWFSSDKPGIEFITLTHPASGESFKLEVIHENVEAIRLHKIRGHNIIVWSAGGGEWAKLVVDALGIEPYVDACMSKPNWFYDDMPSSHFMPEHNRKHRRLKQGY